MQDVRQEQQQQQPQQTQEQEQQGPASQGNRAGSSQQQRKLTPTQASPASKARGQPNRQSGAAAAQQGGSLRRFACNIVGRQFQRHGVACRSGQVGWADLLQPTCRRRLDGVHAAVMVCSFCFLGLAARALDALCTLSHLPTVAAGRGA